VRLAKETVSEEQLVQDTVRKEAIRVEGDGDVVADADRPAEGSDDEHA
jgi:stress response protein YsnF